MYINSINFETFKNLLILNFICYVKTFSLEGIFNSNSKYILFISNTKYGSENYLNLSDF